MFEKKMTSIKINAVRFMALMILSASLPHTTYAGDRCAASIEEIASSYDLTGKTISKTEIVEIYEGHMGSAAIEYYEGWISFNECKGNLVIRVDRACLLETVYTTTECTVPGLKKY